MLVMWSIPDVMIIVDLFRIASEGVQSMLQPSHWQCPSPEVRGQAWGCISVSDVLLMLDVKYDVVMHLLYAEMLQEHHSKQKCLCISTFSQYNTENNLLSEWGFFFGKPQL